jgi:hypothetical protein
MASSENDGPIIVHNFGGKNINIYIFKLEIVLASRDFWKIMDESNAPPPSIVSNKIKNLYKR